MKPTDTSAEISQPRQRRRGQSVFPPAPSDAHEFAKGMVPGPRPWHGWAPSTLQLSAVYRDDPDMPRAEARARPLGHPAPLHTPACFPDGCRVLNPEYRNSLSLWTLNMVGLFKPSMEFVRLLPTHPQPPRPAISLGFLISTLATITTPASALT